MTEKKTWPSADFAAAAILTGHWYSNVRLHIMARIVALSLLTLLITFGGLYAVWGKQTQFRYILSDTSGKLIDLIPVSKPNHPDEFVVKWAIDAVTRLNTFDYVNYPAQFQEAKFSMTPQGWKHYEQGMATAGMLNSVIGLGAVTTAVPTGPGTVIKAANFQWPDGVYRYAWRVRFPMLITYRSARLDPQTKQPMTNNQAVNVDVTVVRMPEFLNPQGLGVRQLLMSGR
jgi:intracellular multiplication protein IcmL